MKDLRSKSYEKLGSKFFSIVFPLSIFPFHLQFHIYKRSVCSVYLTYISYIFRQNLLLVYIFPRPLTIFQFYNNFYPFLYNKLQTTFLSKLRLFSIRNALNLRY